MFLVPLLLSFPEMDEVKKEEKEEVLLRKERRREYAESDGTEGEEERASFAKV